MIKSKAINVLVRIIRLFLLVQFSSLAIKTFLFSLSLDIKFMDFMFACFLCGLSIFMFFYVLSAGINLQTDDAKVE